MKLPHRIYFVTEAEFADPLQHYSNQEFVLEFEDAAQVLKLWRNPHLGRSSREGAVLSIASKNAVAVENMVFDGGITIIDSYAGILIDVLNRDKTILPG